MKFCAKTFRSIVGFLTVVVMTEFIEGCQWVSTRKFSRFLVDLVKFATDKLNIRPLCNYDSRHIGLDKRVLCSVGVNKILPVFFIFLMDLNKILQEISTTNCRLIVCFIKIGA
jgi:hypothetical protein